MCQQGFQDTIEVHSIVQISGVCVCCWMSNDSITFLLVSCCSNALTLATSQSTQCSLDCVCAAIPFFVSPVLTVFSISPLGTIQFLQHTHSCSLHRDLVDHPSSLLLWSCGLHLHQGLPQGVFQPGDHLDIQGEADALNLCAHSFDIEEKQEFLQVTPPVELVGSWQGVSEGAFHKMFQVPIGHEHFLQVFQLCLL